LEGIVVDDDKAGLRGNWTQSQSQSPFLGSGYRHDNNQAKGDSSAIYRTEIETGGEYEVRVAYSAHENRASNVPVTVRTASGEDTREIDQRQRPPIDNLFISVGRFTYESGDTAEVEISNTGTDGYVIIDAVQWLPVD